jgi:hypothetical protein
LSAKEKDDNTDKMPKTNRWYWGNSFEGAMFSTGNVQNLRFGSKLAILRFTYFINAGSVLNFKVSNGFTAFTGIDIKNIGFIEKMSDSTLKHRTYNVGVPVGIKLGDIAGHRYFFAGIDIETPVNYKEKVFTSRNHKSKFNEWFSDRTSTFMPGIFAGFSVHPGVSFKLEYYLSNFLNPEFTDNGVKPYAGYDVHLMLLSIGMDINYKKKDRGHHNHTHNSGTRVAMRVPEL